MRRVRARSNSTRTFLPMGVEANSSLEVAWSGDGFAVKTDNHITGDNAGLMRWLSGHDFMHVHTPESASSPRASALVRSRGRICTPSQPRVTRPAVCSCGTISLIASMGMASPTSHGQQWLCIIPTTSPRMLTSGPPLLPVVGGIGLEVASDQATSPRTWRFLPLTMPRVIVCSRNRRDCQSPPPTHQRASRPELPRGRVTGRGRFCSQLEQGHIAKQIASQDGCCRGLAISTGVRSMLVLSSIT